MRVSLKAIPLVLATTVLFTGCPPDFGDPDPAPPTHACTITGNDEWSGKNFSIDHEDLRICPLQTPVGGTVETLFRILDNRYDRADFPNDPGPPSDEAAFVADVDIRRDEPMGDRLFIGSELFHWGVTSEPGEAWLAAVGVQYQRSRDVDWALFDVGFFGSSSSATGREFLPQKICPPDEPPGPNCDPAPPPPPPPPPSTAHAEMKITYDEH